MGRCFLLELNGNPKGQPSFRSMEPVLGCLLHRELLAPAELCPEPSAQNLVNLCWRTGCPQQQEGKPSAALQNPCLDLCPSSPPRCAPRLGLWRQSCRNDCSCLQVEKHCLVCTRKGIYTMLTCLVKLDFSWRCSPNFVCTWKQPRLAEEKQQSISAPHGRNPEFQPVTPEGIHSVLRKSPETYTRGMRLVGTWLWFGDGKLAFPWAALSWDSSRGGLRTPPKTKFPYTKWLH